MAERNSSGPGSREGSEPGKGSKTELKAVVVGDGGCGKTSLLLVHAKGAFPEQYAPSVFEKYTTNVAVGKKEVVLHLYDTAGQEDYDRLRPLSYQNTHVVLICYDVMNPFSFDNVSIKGEEACCQIGASVYLECSAKFRENVEPIFSEAASVALNAIKKAKRQKKSRPCVLL